tara:strand:- start:65 stop:208 length:144 start_codon:yes stop_codon:yes gene_type:complete
MYNLRIDYSDDTNEIFEDLTFDEVQIKTDEKSLEENFKRFIATYVGE